MPAPMSRAEAQRIVESAIRMSKAEGVSVQVGANATGNTRFAANQLTTSGIHSFPTRRSKSVQSC